MRSPRWLPGLVVGLCCVLVAAGMFLADRPSYLADARDSIFVAPDGAAWYTSSTVTTRPAGGKPERITRRDDAVESARYDGPVAVQAGDAAVIRQALQPLGTRTLAGARIWRTVASSADPKDDQLTTFYRVDQGIRRLAESGRDAPTVYDPALVELPAGVRPDDHWTSAGELRRLGPGGSAADGSYRAELRATAATGGCLQVRGRITITAAAPSSMIIERRWCPGLGLVEDMTEGQGSGSEAGSTTSIRTERQDSPGAPMSGQAPDSDPVPADWRPAERWADQKASTVSVAPGLDSTAEVEIPAFVAPGVTASGALARVTIPGRDVVIIASPQQGSSAPGSGEPQAWPAGRRMHPGGDVVSVGVFGEVVVVGTTDRRLVGYTSAGFRLWQLPLDDLARTAPVRTGADTAVAASVAGSVVAFDLRTGARLWTTSLGADVETAPSVGGGAVIVSDRSGRLSRLDPDTGRTVWQRDADAADQLMIMDGRVLLAHSSTLDAFALDSGRRSWRVELPGAATGLGPLADRVLASSAAGSRVISPSGRVLAGLPGYQQLAGLPAGADGTAGPNPRLPVLVGWSGDRLDLISSDGQTLRRFPVATDVRTLSPLTWLVADRGGVLLLTAPEWTFRRFG